MTLYSPKNINRIQPFWSKHSRWSYVVTWRHYGSKYYLSVPIW